MVTHEGFLTYKESELVCALVVSLMSTAYTYIFFFVTGMVFGSNISNHRQQQGMAWLGPSKKKKYIVLTPPFKDENHQVDALVFILSHIGPIMLSACPNSTLVVSHAFYVACENLMVAYDVYYFWLEGGWFDCFKYSYCTHIESLTLL